jgi:hypothetical protein
MGDEKLNVKPAMLPQLMGTLNKDGEYILPASVADTLTKIKKVSSDDPNQIVFTGYSSFESLPCYDKKAFRYISKDGKMFLCERCESMGGAEEETVLTELGDFAAGTELNPDFTEIAKIKEGKSRQRRQQLAETERLAKRALNQINKILPEEIKTEFNKQCEEMKRFVRSGKPDFYASQMTIMQNLAVNMPDTSEARTAINAVCGNYTAKVEDKNQKWKTARLKEPKEINGYVDRIGMSKNEGIGEIDITAREKFDAYYIERVPQILPYLLQENEEIIADIPVPPKEVFVKYAGQIDELNAAVTQQNEKQIQSEAQVQKETQIQNEEIQTQVLRPQSVLTQDIRLQSPQKSETEPKKDLEDGGISV